MNNLVQKPSLFKKGTYVIHSVLKSLLWNHPISNHFQQLCLTVSHLQCTSVLLWVLFVKVATKADDLLTIPIRNLAGSLSIQTLFTISMESSTSALLPFNLILLLYFAIIFLLCVPYGNNGHSLCKRNIMLAYFSQFHLAIAFWIINTILMNYLAIGLFSSDTTKLTSTQVITSILSLVNVILSYLLGLLLVFFSYDPFMTSNLLCCHTPSFQILNFLFKASFAPVIAFVHNSDVQTWLLAIFALVGFLGGEINSWSNFPYFQYRTMRNTLIFNTINLIISLFILAANIIKDQRDSPLTFVMVMVIPLAVKFVMIRLDSIMLKYIQMQEKDLKSQGDVIKKLFVLCFIVNSQSSMIDDKFGKIQHRLLFQGILPSQKEMCNLDYSVLGKNMIKNVLQHAISISKQNELFKILLAKFALDNDFPFLTTSICISGAMRSYGYYKLASLALAQALQKKIDDFFIENTGKIIHFQKFSEIEIGLHNLKNRVQSISKKYLGFWENFLESKIKMKELYNKSKEIEQEAEGITRIWQNLADKNKIFGHRLSSIYSLYLSLIRASPFEAQNVIERYFVRKFNFLQNSDHLSDKILLDPNIVAFSASMSPDNLGRILNASSNLTKLLGWALDDIKGQTSERLMPSFMHEAHYKLQLENISKAFNGIQGSRMYKTINTFVLHKLGHIIPIDAYLSIHPVVQDTPRYIVLIRSRKVQGEHLLVSKEGLVEAYTENIGKFLGLSLNQRVELTSLCESSAELEEILKDPFLKKVNNNNNRVKRQDIIELKEIVIEENLEQTPEKLERSFNLNFYKHGQGWDAKYSTKTYLVKLIPSFFGDILYFTLILTEQVKFENTAGNENININSPEIDDSIDSLFDEFVEENNVNAIPISNFKTRNIERLNSHALPHETNIRVLTSRTNTVFRTQNFVLESNRVTEFNDFNKTDREYDILSARKNRSDTISSARPLIGRPTGYIGTYNGEDKTKDHAKMEKMMAKSLNGTSKNSTDVLESAVKLATKDQKTTKLYILMVIFTLIFSVPLIVFRLYNKSILVQVQNDVQTISKSIFRLVAVADAGQYARVLWDFYNGLFAADRYVYLGWDDVSTDYIRLVISKYSVDLNTKNNELRSFVYELDETLQDELYSQELPIYEMNKDGDITSERTGNPFDIITEIAVESTDFLTSDLPLDKNNPHMMFLLNNTFNGVLTASEDTVYILDQDSKVKLDSHNTYLYSTMSAFAVVGVLLLIIFLNIERGFIKDRKHFITIFSILDGNTVEKHIQQVQGLLEFLETSNFDTNIRVNSELLSGYSVTRNRNRNRNSSHMKRTVVTTGISSILVILYCAGILSVLLLFSVYPALISETKSGNASIVTKMHLMIQSDLTFFYTNFLFKTLYEYVQENITTTIRNQPIKQEWELIYSQMLSSQSFLLDSLLEPGNGLSDNPQLQQMIKGDMCSILHFDWAHSKDICYSMGAGACTRGLVGFIGYTLASVKEVKDYFDNSARTWEDMQQALAFRGFIDIEDFYYDSLNAAIWVDELIRAQLFNDFTAYEVHFKKIVIWYLVVYILVGGGLFRKITDILGKEMSGWRKLLRQIPHSVMADSKPMKAYIAKISNRVLEKME